MAWRGPELRYAETIEEISRIVARDAGFVLQPVVCPGLFVARALERGLIAAGLRTTLHAPRGSDWLELPERLLSGPQGEGHAVIVFADEEVSPPLARALAMLNERRELLIARLAAPLLWCGPPQLHALAQERMPDLWSVRAITQTMKGEPAALPYTPRPFYRYRARFEDKSVGKDGLLGAWRRAEAEAAQGGRASLERAWEILNGALHQSAEPWILSGVLVTLTMIAFELERQDRLTAVLERPALADVVVPARRTQDALRALTESRWAEAVPLLERCRDLASEIGEASLAAFWQVELARALAQLGRWEEAEAQARGAVDAAGDDTHAFAPACQAIGEVFLLQDRDLPAVEAYREAVRAWTRLGEARRLHESELAIEALGAEHIDEPDELARDANRREIDRRLGRALPRLYPKAEDMRALMHAAGLDNTLIAPGTSPEARWWSTLNRLWNNPEAQEALYQAARAENPRDAELKGEPDSPGRVPLHAEVFTATTPLPVADVDLTPDPGSLLAKGPTEVAEHLADLLPRISDARRIAWMSGLNPEVVHDGISPSHRWRELLMDAHRRGMEFELLRTLAREHPEIAEEMDEKKEASRWTLVEPAIDLDFRHCLTLRHALLECCPDLSNLRSLLRDAGDLRVELTLEDANFRDVCWDLVIACQHRGLLSSLTERLLTLSPDHSRLLDLAETASTGHISARGERWPERRPVKIPDQPLKAVVSLLSNSLPHLHTPMRVAAESGLYLPSLPNLSTWRHVLTQAATSGPYALASLMERLREELPEHAALFTLPGLPTTEPSILRVSAIDWTWPSASALLDALERTGDADLALEVARRLELPTRTLRPPRDARRRWQQVMTAAAHAGVLPEAVREAIRLSTADTSGLSALLQRLEHELPPPAASEA